LNYVICYFKKLYGHALFLRGIRGNNFEYDLFFEDLMLYSKSTCT